MIRNILLIIASLISVTSMAGEGSPQATFETEEYDFGAFDENDGVVTCRFAYVNTGDAPLVIVASRATCGCTSSHYTKTPIEPGDTGYVEVTYNPTGRPGRFSKKVYVDFNTERPRTTLLIKGVVIGSGNTLRGRYPVEAGSMRLRSDNLLLGEVQNGKSKTAFVEVYNATADSITPRWIYTPRGVQLNTTTPTIGPGEQATYTAYFVPQADMYGIYTDSLTVGVEGEDPHTISVVAIVDEDFSRWTPGQLRQAPAIEVDNTTLEFGKLSRDGGPVTRTFRFKNAGNSPMIVRRVYTTDPGVTVETDAKKIKKGKEAVVTVTVDPTKIPTEILNGRISIIVNDPVNPTTVVRAVGEIDK